MQNTLDTLEAPGMTNAQEMSEPDLQKWLNFARKIADKNGYDLNPDVTQLNRLFRHLAENRKNYGKSFCPCKQHFPVQPNIDPVCPCSTFHDEIEQQGHCAGSSGTEEEATGPSGRCHLSRLSFKNSKCAVSACSEKFTGSC
jgi:ferredoxin-thioredoxin reductase catalytic subunit